jgi:hypothetical protein
LKKRKIGTGTEPFEVKCLQPSGRFGKNRLYEIYYKKHVIRVCLRGDRATLELLYRQKCVIVIAKLI